MTQEDAEKVVSEFVARLSVADFDDQVELQEDFFDAPNSQFHLIKTARSEGAIDDKAWSTIVLSLADAGCSQCYVEAGDALRMGAVIPKDFDRAWKFYESAIDFDGPDGKCHDLLMSPDSFRRGFMSDLMPDLASNEWWEYAAKRSAAPYVEVCNCMARIYSDGSSDQARWFQNGIEWCLRDPTMDSELEIEFLKQYLRFRSTMIDEQVEALASRLLDELIAEDYYDNDIDVEGFLDALFAVEGCESAKERWKDKIEADCETHKRFRRWMGRRLFDKYEERVMAKCCGCLHDNNVKECAILSLPGGEMPFCRECCGKWFWSVYDD